MTARLPRLAAVGAWRALGEALLLWGALTLILAPIWPIGDRDLFNSIVWSGLLGIGALGGVWAALRLRYNEAAWRQLRHEIARSVGAALILTGLWLVASLIGGNALIERSHDGVWIVALAAVCVLYGIGFFGVRLLLRLWLFWNELRRTRLVWELTHAHLMVVVVAALLALLILTLAQLAGTAVTIGALPGENPLTTTIRWLFASWLPVVAGLSAITLTILALVLPPVALVSYIVSRQMLRRLAALAQTTTALRGGDYSARVAAEGSDEVARLQADFNTMAIELERAMQAIKLERDTVAGLLQERRELVASVSHELRTPVATIGGYLDVALERWQPSLPEELRHDLEIMARETERMHHLIDDLFTLSRAEAGRLTLRQQPVDVADLLTRLAETIRPTAWRTGRVAVLDDAAPGLPLALADPERMEQALGNLVRNALRHTPPGGIIALTARADPPMIIIEVKDTGEGIAPDDLPYIWERFYRADSARAQEADGAGLGLALVKELIETMGGSVGVVSTPDQGSCFTLRLPLVPELAVMESGVER